MVVKEFDQVMNSKKINWTKIAYAGNISNVYLWHDMMIYQYETIYAEIKGQIPKEVLDKLYNDSTWEIGITIDGQVKYSPNRVKKPFIDVIYCERMEDLLLFINAMNEYYDKKQSNYTTDINSIYQALFSKFNIDLSKSFLLRSITNNNEIVSRPMKSSNDKAISELLDIFDQTVNPFLNPNIKVIDTMYNDHVNIIFEQYDGENGYPVGSIEYHSPIFDNYSFYHRDINNLSFLVSYKIGESTSFTFSHYYSLNSDKELNEKIFISYVGDNDENNIDIRYNLTNNQLENDIKGVPVTEETKTLIVEEITKAIEMAKKLSIDTIIKESNVSLNKKIQ